MFETLKVPCCLEGSEIGRARRRETREAANRERIFSASLMLNMALLSKQFESVDSLNNKLLYVLLIMYCTW